MKGFVVDASAVAAAFFQEPHAKAAESLLASGKKLHAPDLLAAELANVIWKRFGRNEIDAEEASQLLADFQSLPFVWTSSQDLIDTALELAIATGRTVYDCIYVALAVKTGCAMVTADKRLVNALANTPLGRHVTLLGDLG